MLDSSLPELKRELAQKSSAQLLEICLKLGRYKKENKEFLSFLLFQTDRDAFLEQAKEEMSSAFAKLPPGIFQARKVIRKILKEVVKLSRFSASKIVEAELRMYFCREILQSGISLKRHAVLENMYRQQLKLIARAIATLHEDLQFDLQASWEEVSAGFQL